MRILRLIEVKYLAQGTQLVCDRPGTRTGTSCRSAGKESTCNAGDPRLIPGSGRFPGEGIGYLLQYSWAFLMVQMVNNPPAIRETWVQSLGWEDPLEKGMAPHSSILAWGFQGHKELDTTECLSLLFPTSTATSTGSDDSHSVGLRWALSWSASIHLVHSESGDP